MYKQINNQWYITDKELLVIANYIIDTHSSLREMQKILKISKSTLHNMIHKRLPRISYVTYQKVLNIFKNNYINKNIKGGESTKQKYLLLEENSNN